MSKTKPSSSAADVRDCAELPVGDELGAAELAKKVAENLRRLRKERSLSLDQLAAQSGVSRAALSQIESSKTNPTLAVLWKVAVGLGVPFQSLLGVEEVEKAKVVRCNETIPLKSADGLMESRLLTPGGITPGVEVYELRFATKGSLKSEPHSPGTSETIVVLAGCLRVNVGEEHYDLNTGDTIFFRADIPHGYLNRGSKEAKCLDIIAYGRSLV
jgi:XRE family transcriptional regulator, regulator of sulfur utilization